MARPSLLDVDAIEALMEKHPSWVRQGDALRKSFVFADFSEAFAFMTRVAIVAEILNHHPNWSNVWNTVDIAITTHDQGGLTALDRSFIERVERIAAA